ncbi:hypothetical protein MINS_12580 [Mycolicibacterium insubricum]|uniref:Minor tail protein n=1 Tax=Mycolicibacterium insubricum TaxID=444597 RepID=A0A1X0D848_9MYCO|nr:hypothetical protein [Mycolicibacterium insubricum]MCV7080220.1 hypothetical protein [Mycolicibacterium insubricum]ORA68518.1 hypothetical protein BST26_14310 [Mycolicibacterium insubricum]BBZ65829.1 hypothetical protein MINS_12580 [Mycolicibacterium insubricum]
MPASIDLGRAVAVTHNPNQRLDQVLPPLPPFNPQQVLDGFLQMVKDLTGLDLTQLRDALQGIDLTQPGSILTAIAAGALNLGRLAQALGLPDVDLDDPPTIDEIRTWLQDRWTGVIDLARIPRLPWSHLVDGSAELLTDPGFDAEFSAGSGVVPDKNFGRRKPGSARFACDGGLHTAVSNLIPVDEGETLPVSVWVFYEEIVATAGQNAIRMSVRDYRIEPDGTTRTLLATTLVAGVLSPVGESADHPDQVDDWVKLAGEFTVPAGVDEVVLEVQTTPDATDGTMWADDASVTKTRDGMPQEWILHLVPELTDLGHRIEAVVDAALDALGLPKIGSLFDKLLDFQDGLETLQDTADQAWVKGGQALTNAAAVVTDLASAMRNEYTGDDEAMIWIQNTFGFFSLSMSGFYEWISTATTSFGWEDWQDFRDNGIKPGALSAAVVDGLELFQTVQDQINALLSPDPDLMVVPINALVQDVKDFIIGNGAKTSRLTGDGKLDKTNVLGLQVALDGAGQDVRDAICNSMGMTGTGHTAADVVTALTQIPASVVQSGIDGATTIDNAIQKVIDGAIQGAGDLVGSGFAIGDLIAQIAGLRKATSGANSAVLDVQSQLAGLNPAASSEIVNFAEFANASTPPSMFTKINDVGSGGIVTSGGQLVWSGGTGREFYAFNGGPLQTDLFEVSAVLPAVPSHGWLGADDNNYVYLFGRCDSGGDNMVIARAAWDEVRVYSFNSGTFTQIGSTLSRSDVLTGGCRISFKGGTVVEPKRFTVAVNGEVVHNVLDSGNVSLIGTSYRLCGHGIEKGGSYDTARIATWSMMDGGASAGSGVVAGYSSSGLTNLGLWKGTAAQYAAIGTKSSSTIYVVAG